MSKGFLDSWTFNYQMYLRKDGWWNAVIYANNKYPLAVCESSKRIDAECAAFNEILNLVVKENKRDEEIRNSKEV